MVLVDTSVWIDYFRKSDSTLSSLLNSAAVLTHPFVLGELACGNLKNRAETLSLLRCLPKAVCATDEEVMHLIENRKLAGRGLGWTDMNLLASAKLSYCGLFTYDHKLDVAAQDLKIGRTGSHLH